MAYYMMLDRRAFAAIFAFLIVLSIVAVGIEFVVRLVLPPFPKYAVWMPGTKTIYQPSDLGTPGVTGAGLFRVNSLGMRSDEPPTDRKQTIYLFGGSTAAEFFVDQERTWALQIQKKLNAVPHYPKTWVGNLSAPGQLALQDVLLMQHLVPELPKPDLILDQLGGTDIQWAIHSSYPQNVTLEEVRSWAFEVTPESYSFWRRLAAVRLYNNLGSVNRHTADGNIAWRRCRQEAPAENVVDQMPDLIGALADYRKNLVELVDRADALGIRMSLLTQPALWSDHVGPQESARLLAGGVGPNNVWCETHRYYSPRALAEGLAKFNAITLNVCQERNLFCIDLATEVPKKAEYFQDDLHYTDAGAELISTIVSNAILKSGSAKGDSAAEAR
jgi:hypothetical protein